MNNKKDFEQAKEDFKIALAKLEEVLKQMKINSVKQPSTPSRTFEKVPGTAPVHLDFKTRAKGPQGESS